MIEETHGIRSSASSLGLNIIKTVPLKRTQQHNRRYLKLPTFMRLRFNTVAVFSFSHRQFTVLLRKES